MRVKNSLWVLCATLLVITQISLFGQTLEYDNIVFPIYNQSNSPYQRISALSIPLQSGEGRGGGKHVHTAHSTLDIPPTTEKVRRYELDEIRIVASSPSESVGNVEIIHLENTPKANDLNLSDLLKNVSGVNISTGGRGESNLQIRGFRKENVKIMVDGRQINGGYFGNVNLAEMPVFDISEVHIIKGAVSPLYGANSSGGVVNFVSRRPDDQSWLTIRSSIKRNDTQSLQIITAHKFPLWDYWLNVSGYRTNGFMLSKDFKPTRYENGSIRNLSNNQSLDIQTKLNYTLLDVHSLGIATGYTFAPQRNVPNNIYENRFRRFTDWRRYNFSGLGSFHLSPNIVIKPSVSYDAYDNTLLEFNDENMTNQTLHSILENWTLSPQIRSEYTFGKDGKLFHLAKYEKQIYNRKDDGNYPNWTTNMTHLLNSSVMYTHNLSQNIKTSASAGISQSSRRFTNRPTGDLQETVNTPTYVEPAFSIHYDDKVYNASFAISRNVQYPTLHNLYSYTRGNVHLKPEKAIKTEVSLGRFWSFPKATIKLENSIFHNQIDGLIDRVNSPIFINERNLKNAGIELSLTTHLLNRIETQHQFAYINLNMNKDYDFSEIPARNLNNTIYIEAIKDFRFSYSINATNKMYSPDIDGNLMTLPAKTLHNAGILYKYKNYKLAFTLSNLFDLNYSEEYGYPAPGRNYSLSIEWIVF